MQYSKVEGHLNLIRNEETKAVINTNINEYQKYLDQKITKEKEHNKIKSLESDIFQLKLDISEIKTLLYQVIKKL